MLNAWIREFVEPTPVCLHTAPLSLAIEIFYQQSIDRLVVVNEQQHPIGLVHLRQLLPFLQQSEIDTERLIDFDLLEALPSLAADLRFGECDEVFQKTPARFWALVDPDRQYQGLIDSFSLRKLLDVETRQSETHQKLVDVVIRPAAGKLATPKKSSESLWHQAKSEVTTPESTQSQAEISRLKQQLQMQISELQFASRNPEGTPLQARQTLLNADRSESSSSALRSLLQFLERLPLPLMLQTNHGEVIARNPLWNEQFGELVDPEWVQRDAAAILKYATPTQALSDSEVPTNPPRQPPSEISSFKLDALTQLCQIGSTPNTCVCVCPLKNGQERVLQLVKIPLGTLLPGREFELAQFESSETHRQAGLEHPFQLATLENPLSPESTHVPLRAFAEETLWLVLAQDVTEQQQLARELAAKNADLVQLNRLKDEFLACISHELRTPLTAVLGLSSLLKDQLSGSMSERQVRYAQLIYRSGRHLMAIVNDMLDLTRMETGQLELTLYSVNIASVCDRAFEQARQLCLEEEKPETHSELGATAALPTFTLEIEPGLETLVADELRLRQMLVNLLSNALKFTDATGNIGLKVSRWEGWIAFMVWDTGIGIPAEKQHLIFQKFQQLENPMTRRFEGAGLGLVLTQRLARLHGGDISFVSKENQGSQFTLLLPPTHPQPTIALGGSAPRVSTSSANRLVLVVDTVVRSIDTLSEQLTELGYRVVIARAGTEAVEKARRLQPCAVLLNPLLPTLSGWDVLTLLKAEPETRQIPVIITGTRGDREQATRHQADGFLSLPVVHKALRQVLMQVTVDEASAPIANAQQPGRTESSTCTLVILRLSPTRYGQLHRLENRAAQSSSYEVLDLNTLLHSHNYRVLEADDLEQAELLAQVWKPNVVLLDAAVPDPISYLKLLGERTFLASLPLVTLDLATTQAANQIPGLSVFPCLAPLVKQSVSSGQSETSALLQVIQVAAGFAWRPLVLAVDASQLMTARSLKTSTKTSASGNLRESDWLQALIQYLQTAGFRGVMARSWQEVMQKLQNQGVDLLLLYWHDAISDEDAISALSELKQLKEKPPVLVIDHRSAEGAQDESISSSHSSSQLLNELATQVLPPLAMEELLNQVNHLLTD